MKRVGIIGAGPAGLIAAIEAAGMGADVTLFEKNDRVGKKILVTGNGRCNFTNSNMVSSRYYTDDTSFIDRVYSRFSNEDLVSYFYGLGLLSKNKNGYYYPLSEQASSVLDVLRFSAAEKNVHVICDSRVTNIVKRDSSFCVECDNNENFCFDSCVVATGGKAGIPSGEKVNGYDLVKRLGHSVSKLFPSLTQIKCEGLNFKAISGVRSDCVLYAFSGEENMCESGEVLFTDFGISGIVSFQVSHFVAKALDKKQNVKVSLDLFPGMSIEALKEFVSMKLLLHPELSVEDFFAGIINKKIAVEVAKNSGLKLNRCISEYDKDFILDIFVLFKSIELACVGTNDFKNAQVTGGGVPLSEINDDFESKLNPGLYIVGELLDVDGVCGGYNLQWAFSSGYLAGRASAK